MGHKHDSTPEDRSMIGRAGAHASWARTTNRALRTAPARQAAIDRFEKEVDPNGTLSPEVRAQRAEHARKSYFQLLARKSARARSENGAAGNRSLERYTKSAAKQLGWVADNVGEATVALALADLDYLPHEVQQQWRIGPYKLDFAWPQHQIDLEADGYPHTTQLGKTTDRKRDRELSSWGWTVFRIDVTKGDDLITAQLAELNLPEPLHGQRNK